MKAARILKFNNRCLLLLVPRYPESSNRLEPKFPDSSLATRCTGQRILNSAAVMRNMRCLSPCEHSYFVGGR